MYTNFSKNIMPFEVSITHSPSNELYSSHQVPEEEQADIYTNIHAMSTTSGGENCIFILACVCLRGNLFWRQK